MLQDQIAKLFLLSLPIACISWTITHEEIFLEPRNFCIKKSQEGKTLLKRKFFYLFTCEYCFSHYITILFLIISRYHLLYLSWRGYLVACFALVWISNIYMSLFNLLRVSAKKEKMDADVAQAKIKNA